MSFSLLHQALRGACSTLLPPQCRSVVARRWNSSSWPGWRQNELWKTVSQAGELKNTIYTSPEHCWQSASGIFTRNSSVVPHTAYSGRSVVVREGDVARSARTLERLLSVNNVVREWHMSKRHQPKGEERRKLKSSRWRKRFKYEVSKKVELVQQIRRRGA